MILFNRVARLPPWATRSSLVVHPGVPVVAALVLLSAICVVALRRVLFSGRLTGSSVSTTVVLVRSTTPRGITSEASSVIVVGVIVLVAPAAWAGGTL